MFNFFNTETAGSWKITFLCQVPFSDKQLTFPVNSILIQYFETIHGGCTEVTN